MTAAQNEKSIESNLNEKLTEVEYFNPSFAGPVNILQDELNFDNTQIDASYFGKNFNYLHQGHSW